QELSKGMQQKLQFIGAILHEPELVILDEPFSGLDPVNQRALRGIITDLKRQGRTIIFSTHIIEHAERICDHVCIMARGAKVVDGPIPAVKRAHGSGYIAVAFEEWSDEAVESLRDAPGVRALREHGTEAEVSMDDGADPHDLLEHLVRHRLRLRRFERVEPSLEQIFVDRVGAEEDGALHASAATREVARV
ncbi:MAG: ABC transporter ATP-binding protein, partial [Gemmatimonadota bacterium]